MDEFKVPQGGKDGEKQILRQPYKKTDD